MRFWLSSGRGDFNLSTKSTLGTEMYCIFYNGPYTEPDITKGWKVKPSPIPNKPGVFSELKSVNYLQNALNLMDAEDAGCDHGIFLHPDGTICEGPNLNFAIVKDGVVHTPEFRECLRGCTMQRILDLIPEYAQEDLIEGVTSWKQASVLFHSCDVLIVPSCDASKCLHPILCEPCCCRHNTYHLNWVIWR